MTSGETHKVAFTGAGGVGKTAVLKGVMKTIDVPAVGFVSEAARAYFKQWPGLPESERYSFFHQERIQIMAMNLEHMADDPEFDYVFTDRSVFDAAVCVASTGDAEGAETLFKDAEMWLPGKSELSYSQIYVLDPADVRFRNDAQRTESAVVRQQQHESFLEFFSSHGITHKLLSGSKKQRISQVLAELPRIASA